MSEKHDAMWGADAAKEIASLRAEIERLTKELEMQYDLNAELDRELERLQSKDRP